MGKKIIVEIFSFLVFSFLCFGSDLQILVANPQGELYNIEQFDSIEILFSQRMVDTLKESGSNATLPSFITIKPSFETLSYWSNDRLLKIVPKDIEGIKPQAEIKVTVKKGTQSLEGGVLQNDYTFTFSLPVNKVVWIESYRKNTNLNSPYVIAILFNYDIDREEVAKCLKLSYIPNKKDIYKYGFDEELKRIVEKREPLAINKYEKKVKYLFDRPEKEAFFHILDTKNEEIQKFINRCNIRYYIEEYSEERLLLIETDDGPPVQSVIKVDFQGEKEVCPEIDSKASLVELFENENALFFKGISLYYDYKKTSSFSTEEETGLLFTKKISKSECLNNLKLYDLTDKKEFHLPVQNLSSSGSNYFSLKSLGFEPEVGHKYLLRIDENLKAEDGEILGYPAYAMFTIKLSRANISFGEGEGVWERSRGTLVPFYAKNVKKVKQNIVPLKKEDVIQTLNKGFSNYDDKQKLSRGEIREIKGLKPEKVFNAGIDLKPYLNDDGYGIVLAEVELSEPLEGASVDNSCWRVKKSVIQVTDLGITLKYGPNDFLVVVTSLSKGDVVSDCEIEIRNFKNEVLYTGVTDKDGVLKVDKKPFSSVDDYSSYYTQEFVVFAQKGNDIAYIVNNWCEGLEPWNFSIPYYYNITETPEVAGIVFSDRGVYKFKEEVHFKAILRDKQKGEKVLFPTGTEVEVTLYDSKEKVKERKKMKLSSLSSIDGLFSLGEDYPLGYYRIEIKVLGKERNENIINGSFLVASYRKPDFRVNVELEKKEDRIEGKISSSYLFGMPLSEGKVKYFYEERVSYLLPDSIRKNYKPWEWEFYPYYYECEQRERLNIQKKGEGTLDKNGELKLSFDFSGTNIAKTATLEAEVEDITKQVISNNSEIVIYPEYFIGIYKGNWGFYDYEEGLKTKIVVVDKEGNLIEGKKVELALKKVVYKSAQLSTGYNYYDWESRRDYEVVSEKVIESGEKAVGVNFDLPSGGEYILNAKFAEKDKVYVSNCIWWFYGRGYTPWERYTSNKIDLLVEKQSYKVGETAKIMVQSPWEKAKMIVTKEREAIKSVEIKELNSTQEIVEIPVKDMDVPNIFVSVVLIKGRGSEGEQDKPQIRIGYAKISVEKEQKKLNVKIESEKEEYKPAEKCKVKLSVKNHSGNSVSGAEVTLWAVDVGVLNLTNYKTPDLMEKLYKEESLSIFNADSREKLISARVTTPKGEDEGGGGGVEPGPVDQIRKDFRVLAFWVGSALTDSEGKYEGEFKLPESLTSFRIMAVVHTKDNLFGSAEKEIKVAKDLMVNPYFPRFLILKDSAYARVLITSRKENEGKCRVKMESLTPEILLIHNGEAEENLPAKGKKEFKFQMNALKTGRAKIRVCAEGLDEKDAFEVEIPVIMPHNGSVRVKSGSFVRNETVEGEIPQNIYPEMGELTLEVSKNLLTQFSESYEFVVNYPYGCAEQRSSALMTLLNNYKFAKSIGKEGSQKNEAEKVIVNGIKSLEPFQNDDGGFGVWVSDEISFPYLSAYIGKLLVDAEKEGLVEDKEILKKAIDYLRNTSKLLKGEGVEVENTREALALSAKVLAEYGEIPDNILTRLSSNLGSLQTITLCHLWDAAVASKRVELSTKIESVVKSRLSISGQEAYLKEVGNKSNYYYWYSSDITTSVGLKSFITNTKDYDIVEKLANTLVKREQQIDPYDYNTHRNAYVYEALAAYSVRFNKEEGETKIFCKISGARLPGAVLAKENGWMAKISLPIKELLKYSKSDFKIEFESNDNSQINYLVKLKWYPNKILSEYEDRGFKIERKYFDLITKEEKESFKAGDLIEVQLEITPIRNSADVAVIDSLPAGFEVLDSAFATTAQRLNEYLSSKKKRGDYSSKYYYYSYYGYGGFNYIEKYDDKVLLFANFLYNKPIKFSYIVRATTEGEFRLQGANIFCMYNEEVRGSSRGSVIKIERE